jgi:corrinoid protein of di/trimethylamine methyltransferase
VGVLDRHLNKNSVLTELSGAILNYDVETAKKLARIALDRGIEAVAITDKALTPAIREIGDKYQREEIWLPQMMLAADAFNAAFEIIKEKMPEQSRAAEGTIVFGSVKGDIHDIGKKIVNSMLQAAGFKVYDIGKDIDALTFIQKAEELKADIIAASALMTTTMPAAREIVEWLRQKGLREKYKVMVGGGSVTPQFVEEIGADGYGKDGADAVEVARRLLNAKRKE